MENSNLKGALAEAMAADLGWIDEEAAASYDYIFSPGFERAMAKIFNMTGRTYVSVGRHRLRRMVAVALIAAFIMAAAVGAVAIQRAIVRWNTSQNDKQGTMDVTFDVEHPEGEPAEFRYIIPEVPEGYWIVKEEKEIGNYYVKYSDNDGTVISYYQENNVDNMELSLDNEEAEFDEVTINGHKGYSHSKYGNNALLWSDGVNYFEISGTCDMKVLKEISKSIY